MSEVFIVIEFRSHWIHATGGGGGADLDAVMDRDDAGFPVLRGRHVNGILREASRRIEIWGRTKAYLNRPERRGLEGKLTELLFGGRDRRDAPPGCLVIPDFHIHHSIRGSGNPALALAYFHRVASTRIEWESGVPADKSLRSIETAAPCRVGGYVTLDPRERLARHPDESELVEQAERVWERHLEETLWEARRFGAKRTRGFGRALAGLQPVSPGRRERGSVA